MYVGRSDELTLDTFTDVWMLRGAGGLTSLLSFSRIRAANGLETISGGGPKMSFPLSSLDLASEIGFFDLAPDSLSSVPLSSRCFATSVRVVGFFGETLSSALNDI